MSPWELRERGGLYYTRSRKEGGCVIREYVGGGVLGDLAARADELRRREREQAVAADREERDTLEALDAPFTQAWEATEILYRAALVAAGYHQHKRGNGGGGVDQKTKKDEDGDLAPARHRELLDQLREVMEGANDGDEEALSKVKAIFKEAPGMARTWRAKPNAVSSRGRRAAIRSCGRRCW